MALAKANLLWQGSTDKCFLRVNDEMNYLSPRFSLKQKNPEW